MELVLLQSDPIFGASWGELRRVHDVQIEQAELEILAGFSEEF